MKEQIEALAAKWREEAVDSMPEPAVLKTLVRCARELESVLREDAGGWRSMDSAPRDGTPILVFRRIHGWSVYGWARWVDVMDISGWIAHGFFDPPGELGLADPDCWQPLSLPSPPPQEPPR